MISTLGITVYGCEKDEADLFHDLSPRFGVVSTVTSAAVLEASIISVPKTGASAWGTNRRSLARSLAR